MIKLTDILNELVEEKADRCLRIARRKYDKPSAYRSGAIVKCRQGKIWKGLKEDNVPQSGESSGAPAKFKPNSKPEKTEFLTLDQILQQVKGIPYYKEVLDDMKKGDVSWGVTKKVKEYAEYMIRNPSSLKNLPPIIVVDGKIQDGAHRISTIYLIQNLLDPKNNFWKNLKLKVEFWNSRDQLKEDTNTITETYNQSTIKQVFESNPELADIGTPQQYSEYLSTIFPSSKIKDIVYHASPNKIEKFRDTMFGTYFSYSPIEGTYGGIINSALLNVKNPLVKPEPTDSTEEKVIYDKEYRNYNNPSSLYDASIEGSTVTKEGVQIRVKSPEQIHTLGSKQDIEGFKRYVEKKIVEQLVKGTIQEETLQYSKPNFEYEWEEAIRYPEFKEMGKEGWINLASQGRAVRYSDIKQVLGNVDLNFHNLDSDKKARFEKAFNSGTIELPIAVKFSDNDYDLVAGNTRVAGLAAQGIDPKIWVVDLSKKETPKNRVLDTLDQRLGRTLQGTAENRLIKKIIKDVTALDGEELKQYLKSNFLNTKNSWKARIIYNNLYDAFEGIKK